MPNQRKRGVILGYANVVVKNVVNLIYVPMLLSFVSQADYGVFQTANNFIVSLQLLTFGFNGAYIRFYMQRKVKGDEVGIRHLNGMYLILYLAICVIAVVLGFVFSSACGLLFSSGFSEDQVKLAAVVMSVLTLNVATTLFSTVFDSYIVAQERFTFQQSRQMFTSLSTPVLALAMLAAGWGVVGVAVSQLVINILLLGLNAHYAISKLGMQFDVKLSEKGLLKAVVVFSGWVFLNQVFDLVTINVPSVLLAAVTGAVPVAIFAIATQLRTVFYSFSIAVSRVFIPLINKIVAESDNNDELTKLMTRAGRYQALMWWWVLGGFIVLGQWFIEVWAGPDFAQSYWLTIAMVVPATVPLIQNTGIEIQKAKNKHKPRSIVYTISAVIDLVATFLLSAQYGAWAGAIGYDLYIVLGSCLFMNWYYHKRIGLDMVYFWRRTLPIIASCAVSAAVCLGGTFLLPVASLWAFLGWGVVYTLVCMAILWLFALDKKEKEKFVKIFTDVKRSKDGR